MPEHLTYVRIVGEPFLSRARAYRDESQSRFAAFKEFADRHGSDGHSKRGAEFTFRGGRMPPEGWTLPKGDQRWSHPKTKHPDAAELSTLRKKYPVPSAQEVFGGALCDDIRYETPDGGKGGGAFAPLGYIFDGPAIVWHGEDFYALVADPALAVREHLAAHPDHRITNGADTWQVPDGLCRLTEAEYKLAAAQHRVDRERAAASPQVPA